MYSAVRRAEKQIVRASGERSDIGALETISIGGFGGWRGELMTWNSGGAFSGSSTGLTGVEVKKLKDFHCTLED